jgi:phage-related protein
MPVFMIRDCYFVGPVKRVISAMPFDVKQSFGFAFYLAQRGQEAVNVKALKGFGGRGVLE